LKVKTFTGDDPAKVDDKVNKWLDSSGVVPKITNLAVGSAKLTRRNELTGKQTAHTVGIVAISVWYEA